MSRTKLFLVLYFLPSWVASFMMWGDDRTSTNFVAAPPWFYYAKFAVQIGAILLLFMPLHLRARPALTTFAVSVAVIISTFFAEPILEGEFILLNSSMQIAALAMFLSFVQSSARFEASDIRVFFYLFVAGFAVQVFMFLVFGRIPSHSIEDVFIRFNGITNDSLSAGFILPLFIPWAIRSAFPAIKAGGIILISILTGSLFAAIMVPITIMAYAIYQRLYRFAAVLGLGMLGSAIYFYNTFAALIDLKFMSILTHLRFFLNLTGAQYQQPDASCAEEFCESFIESGLNLGPIYMILVYWMLLSFIIPLLRVKQAEVSSPLILDTLRIYGATLIIGSIVHPVPLIPFAVPMFLILTCLYLPEVMRAQSRAAIARNPLTV